MLEGWFDTRYSHVLAYPTSNMPRNDRGGSSTPKKKHPLDPYATNDPDCVAECGWEEEPSPWRMITCKEYVKMKHLMKLIPVHLRTEAAEKQATRGEIRVDNCESDHFKIRYNEIFEAAQIQNSRPHIMLYSNMAMVWAEIVLHKRVDWRTISGLRTDRMNRESMDLDTAWIGHSDCPPLHISNRRSPPTHDAGIQTPAIEYNDEEQGRRHLSYDDDDNYRGRRSNENPRNRGGHRGRELFPTNHQEYGQYSAHGGHRSRERHDVGRHEQGHGYGEPEGAPVTFDSALDVYGTFGGQPWPDYATGSRSYTDGWSEIPSPPRSASPRHRTPPRDHYGTPPPYAIFPPPLGYHNDGTDHNSMENRNVLHPDDSVPPPPFGYPPGRVVRDSYFEEELELERTRQNYVLQMENHAFHLRRENRRLMEERERLLRSSTNSAGHRPQETYDRGGPSELPNDGNYYHPYDYNAFGWRGDY